MLKAMAKKAKSIVALSLPKCLNRRYAMSNFIWSNTASGSMHRRPLSLSPSSDVSSSQGFPLVFVETMVYLDDPSVASSLVAQASQRAEEKENVEIRHVPQRVFADSGKLRLLPMGHTMPPFLISKLSLSRERS